MLGETLNSYHPASLGHISDTIFIPTVSLAISSKNAECIPPIWHF